MLSSHKLYCRKLQIIQHFIIRNKKQQKNPTLQQSKWPQMTTKTQNSGNLPGGHGSSSKSTGFPALYIFTASWYCYNAYTKLFASSIYHFIHLSKKCIRQILRVSWTHRWTNKWVLDKADTKNVYWGPSYPGNSNSLAMSYRNWELAWRKTSSKVPCQEQSMRKTMHNIKTWMGLSLVESKVKVNRI